MHTQRHNCQPLPQLHTTPCNGRFMCTTDKNDAPVLKRKSRSPWARPSQPGRRDTLQIVCANTLLPPANACTIRQPQHPHRMLRNATLASCVSTHAHARSSQRVGQVERGTEAWRRANSASRGEQQQRRAYTANVIAKRGGKSSHSISRIVSPASG